MLLDPLSHDIATFYDDAITPDLHPATVGTMAEAVFKVNVPFYITDASFSGDFVKAHTADVCNVFVSTNGATWTQVWTGAVGTNHVTNQPLRNNVFGTWATWYVKVQLQATADVSDVGVSNFVITTIFEHNKGAMAYLDKGVNHITLTFDNPAELAASGNVLRVVYKWKEFDGVGWNVSREFDTTTDTSPCSFTITTGGSKVPRTESIQMQIVQPDLLAPSPITDLVAPPAGVGRDRVVLNWTATGDDGELGQASRYDVRYSTSPITDLASFNAATQVSNAPSPQVAGSSESFTVTGLAAENTYYLAVMAYDDGNNSSGLSNVVSATTTQDVPPAAVTDLSAPAGSISKTSVQIAWTATGEDGTNGTASSYDLRYSTSPIVDMTAFGAATPVTGLPAPQGSGTAEQVTVSGLTAGSTYNFALVVYDAANQASGLSNVVSVQTLVDSVPAAVTDLMACSSCITRESLQLNWTATGEDGTIGMATSYDLRYSTGEITDMASFNAATPVTGVSSPQPAGSTEAFTLTGLTAGTTYNFALVVYDAIGQASPLSNVAVATTLAPRKTGDVNDDGYINVGDLQRVITAWGSDDQGGWWTWDPDCDFDGDGSINIGDLQILVAHWNS